MALAPNNAKVVFMGDRDHKKTLDEAMEIHRGHMSGKIPTTKASQEKLMKLIKKAHDEDRSSLDADDRKAIPKAKFGLPAQRKYPMPDRSHAADAKARARQMLNKGHISKAEYDKIIAKADRMLGKDGDKDKD